MEIALWPMGCPDGWTRSDKEESVHDKEAGFLIVSKVSVPTVSIHRAPGAKDDAPTILICPGGGYHILAMEHEGTEISSFLNSKGFHAAILKYRLPREDKDATRHGPALQDAQRALRIVRGHVKGKVGIMGFSAGGHLSAMASLQKASTYEAVDASDDSKARPDFTVLVYPAYLYDVDNPGHPQDLRMDESCPPAFLAHTMDDPITVESTFAYARACRQAGVSAEVHVYPKGGHGYGLRSKEAGIKEWPNLLVEWLKRLS